jgi:hypothetical protein
MSGASKERQIARIDTCADVSFSTCYSCRPQLASQAHAPFLPAAGKISKQHSYARKGLYVFLDGTAAFGEAWAAAGRTVSTAREFGGSSQMPPASASHLPLRSADPRQGGTSTDFPPLSPRTSRCPDSQTTAPAPGDPR